MASDTANNQRLVRLGVLVPSSNTAMEPLVTAILSTVNKCIPSIHVVAHFSRFRVTQISLDPSSQSQFAVEKMLEAASLLADAHVDAIAWGGTSAGWLGIDKDYELCNAIEKAFKIPATTSTLALLNAMRSRPHSLLGLITPYSEEMVALIGTNFLKHNIRVVHDGLYHSITNNVAIASLPQQQLADMLHRLMSNSDHGLKTVCVYCTNLSAAHLANTWETAHRDKELLVLDSVSIVVWDLLAEVGVKTKNTGVSARWGALFNLAMM